MNTDTTLPPAAELYAAVESRDSAYEGLFVVGVKTTGIYCRPGCPSRTPRAENVEFFRCPDSARRAGYRACKRCRPDTPAHAEWAESMVSELDADPGARLTEADLARRGLDPATVRRHFLRHYGLTFHAYARSRRLAAAHARLAEGSPLAAATFAGGYESESGFRAAFGQHFGAPPGRGRGGDWVRLAWLPTPLGPVVAGATDAGVCLLEFTDRRALPAQFDALRRHFALPVAPGDHGHLRQLSEELAVYFAGELRAFAVPLVAPGSPFQRRVWDELRGIPYGETRSYQQLAEAIGSGQAARAVGRANGLNRLCVVIPCHRVVNADGALGGYAGGLRRKEYLLDLERRTSSVSGRGVCPPECTGGGALGGGTPPARKTLACDH